MRRIFRAGALFIGLLSGTGTLGAQVADVSPGARIRFRAPPVVATRVTGTVLERHADTLLVGPEKGSPFRVTLGALTTLDLSQGKSRAEGAKVGALWSVGFYAIYAIAIASSGDSCDGSTPCTNTNAPKAGELVAFTVVGAIPGAVIGALIGREKWERVVPASR